MNTIRPEFYKYLLASSLYHFITLSLYHGPSLILLFTFFCFRFFIGRNREEKDSQDRLALGN